MVTTSTSVSLLPAVEAPALVRRSVLLLLVVPVVFVVVWSLKRVVEVDRMGMSLGCLFGVICGWEEISLEWTTSVLLVLER